jgi:hypothetical protein
MTNLLFQGPEAKAFKSGLVALDFLLLDCLEPCQSCSLPLKFLLPGRFLSFKGQPVVAVYYRQLVLAHTIVHR